MTTLATILDAKNALKASLCNSAAFQTLVGAEDATEAAGSVYYDIIDDGAGGIAAPLEVVPFAMVSRAAEAPFSISAAGVGGWTESGALDLEIWRETPTGELTDDTFETLVGTILSELCDQAETAGRLAITGATVEQMSRVSLDKEANDETLQASLISIQWGTSEGGGW